MKFLQSVYNRMPGGTVFKSCRAYEQMLRLITRSGRRWRSEKVWQYMKSRKNNLFWKGVTKKDIYDYRKLMELFEIDPDKNMMKINGLLISPPDPDAIRVWNYEFDDLVLPYIFYDPHEYNYAELEPVFNEGPYEIAEVVHIDDGDVVVDCGANTGMFSAVSLVKGASRVYAFEPLRSICDQYLCRIKKEFPSLMIENYALSDHCGFVDFVIDSNNIGGSGIKDANYFTGCGEVVMVEAVSIDEFVKRRHVDRIDFIKCDIEGAERAMLRGARNVLREMAPKLSICTYHYPEDPQLLEKIIIDSNPRYTVKHSYKKLYAYVRR